MGKTGNEEATRIAAAVGLQLGRYRPLTTKRKPIRRAATVVTVPIKLCQCHVTQM
jgi:hypothetical protein